MKAASYFSPSSSKTTLEVIHWSPQHGNHRASSSTKARHEGYSCQRAAGLGKSVSHADTSCASPVCVASILSLSALFKLLIAAA